MSRRCTVCEHPSRTRMEEAIAGGMSYRAVAKRFNLQHHSALFNHVKDHLTPAIARVAADRPIEARSALERMERLYAKAEAILDAVIEEKRVTMSLAAVKELRSCIELIARLSGELRDQPAQVINILTSPDWLRIQEALLQALEPYPEARAAVVRALSIETPDAVGALPAAAGRGH